MDIWTIHYSNSSQPTPHNKPRLEALDPGDDKLNFIFIPHVAGLSEEIRRVRRQVGIRTAFKSEPTLWIHLTRVKDELHVPALLKSCVVYCISCSRGRFYFGENENQNEGTRGCLQEGGDRIKISHCWTCMEQQSPNFMEWDGSTRKTKWFDHEEKLYTFRFTFVTEVHNNEWKLWSKRFALLTCMFQSCGDWGGIGCVYFQGWWKLWRGEAVTEGNRYKPGHLCS